MNENKDVVRLIKRKYYKQVAYQPEQIDITTTDSPLPTLQSFRFDTNSVKLIFDDLDRLRFAYIFPEQRGELSNKKLIDQVFINDKKNLQISRDKLKGKKKLSIVFTDKFGKKSEPIVVHLKQTN